MEKRSIGNNLVRLRKSKGFTQNRLSEASGVAIRTIQRIEKDTVNPQLETVKLLADSLGVSTDHLLKTEDPHQEKWKTKWLFFIHFSPLIGFIFPFSVLFPLFLWLHKKEDNSIYNTHGIKVINFQLTMTIVYIIAFISLVSIQGWGFLFFILIFPINFLIITYNIFKAVTTQKCSYPLSIPFLKNKTTMQNKQTFLFLFPILISLFACSPQKEKTKFEKFLEYEGKYQYINETTLDIVASQLDTTLYAVIDKAKYPLKQIASDSFNDLQKNLVVFKRDKDNTVIGYNASGQYFELITRNFKKLEMLPRKELLKNPKDYTYKKPIEINDGLKTGSMLDEFENPEKITEMIIETIGGSFPDVHSILIYKNDKLVLEEYFYDNDQNTPHQLRSATKPFIGGVLGIAVDQGYVKSEKEKLLPFFDSTYSEISHLDDRKKEITIEHFLMYRHGLDCDNNNAESQGNEMLMMESEDWVKYTLDLPVITDPGKSSTYCTGCALTIGSLIEKATGEYLEKFAKKNLFDPLGISNYTWIFEPNKESMTNFSQLSLTSRDLIKLAKMYKDKGVWNGQQILSEEWINKTFTMEDGDYGYFWEHKYFIVDGKRFNSYLATGNGGQKINIWPELDMITVFTGGNFNSYAIYGKSTPPNQMIPNYILKALNKM